MTADRATVVAEAMALHEWSQFHPDETCVCGWVSDKYDGAGCQMESAEAVTDDHRAHIAAVVVAALDAQPGDTGQAGLRDDALLKLVAEHRMNAVVEPIGDGRNSGEPYQGTRVKCDGESCDFYAEGSRYWDVVAEHDLHLVSVLLAAHASGQASS